MLNYKCNIKGLLVGIAIAAFVVAFTLNVHSSYEQAQLISSDYPELSKEACAIAVGGNTRQVVLEDIGNEPILKQDVEVPMEDKTVSNLKPTSPYHSKTDATLDLLLTLKRREQVPQEMKEIIMRDTVSVSIRFNHVLNTSEVESIEELGLKFVRLPDGKIAHSGTIYGADVPWDRVYDLAKLEKVVRIESTWKPLMEEPINQDKGK